jgi:hypothetical protein
VRLSLDRSLPTAAAEAGAGPAAAAATTSTPPMQLPPVASDLRMSVERTLRLVQDGKP